MARRKIPEIRRRGPRKEPKQRFILFCEGRNTEPAYFASLRQACAGALIDVETREGVGVAMTVAKEAVNFAKSRGLVKKSRRKKSSFEKKDTVWAVFDRDEHPDFDNAVSMCQANGVRVARSDPCFELWLILHECDYDRPGHRNAVQEALKKLRPEYDRHGRKVPNCDDMVTRVESAEARGKSLLKRREQEGNPYGNPSTTVGALTKTIRLASQSARE